MTEVTNPIESSLGQGRPVELLEMTPEQAARFNDQVRQSDGKIRILIHPLYQEENRLTEDYYILLKKLLSSTSPKMPPIIVFLENC